jgi:hypothetical protein
VPERIQLRRAKGWRLPEGAVTVARPTRWGNPFTLDQVRGLGLAASSDEAKAASVVLYREWLAGSDAHWPSAAESRAARRAVLDDAPNLLRGHDLACWCTPESDCHAAVLLELANAPRDPAG